MKTLRLAALFILFGFLAGCASSGPKLSDMKSSIPALASDMGRIYFYRGNSIFGGAITADIKLNGEVVGRSSRGSFFYVDRPAGNYEVVSSTETEKKATFALAAGETKYVRTRVGLGVLVGRVIPELVDTAEGENEMANLGYEGSAKK